MQVRTPLLQHAVIRKPDLQRVITEHPQEADLPVAVSSADRDVAELAEVAEGDLAVSVDAVIAHPVVGWLGKLGRSGFESGTE